VQDIYIMKYFILRINHPKNGTSENEMAGPGMYCSKIVICKKRSYAYRV